MNTSGIQQLNEYNNFSFDDSLVFDIVNSYSRLTEKAEGLNQLLNEDVVKNLTYWRDNYPWFASFIKRDLRKQDLSYFGKSQEYRNRVAFHYTLVYKNYVPFLQAFQMNARELLNQLDKRLASN